MEEKVFFEMKNLKVTDTKFIVGNKTYVLSNVTSLDIKENSFLGARIFGWIFILVGILCVTGEAYGWAVLWFCLGIILSLVKNQFSVLLRTSGNESSVYSNKKRDITENIINSLNEAVSFKVSKDTTISIADELKKLAELKEANIISNEEFDRQKEILLKN